MFFNSEFPSFEANHHADDIVLLSEDIHEMELMLHQLYQIIEKSKF